MRVALTGASGIVGRWLASGLSAAGHEVRSLGRPLWQLGEDTDLRGCDALVHAALQHERGRYRGGEGADPEGFVRANLNGSVMLFQAAQRDGVGRIVFLSSRAVYDGHAPGLLADDLATLPTSLYGEVKAAVEEVLAQMAGPALRTASLRATGVYGPGGPQKWAALVQDFIAGRTPAPRIATEVHGADLVAALLLVIADPDMGGAYNVSDLVLDRHDLCAAIADVTGCATPLPERADASGLRILDPQRLRALGWQPGGMALLRRDLPAILKGATEENS